MAINLLVFLDVFMANLWFCLAGMLAVLAACLFVIAWQGGGGSKSELHDSRDSESFGILNSVAVVAMVFLQRDYQIRKNSLSIRFLHDLSIGGET